MLIDCDSCIMENTGACDDCIVPVLLSGALGPLEIGIDEEDALRNLADAGLVAPLRLISRGSDRDATTA
jgi:hypothetical protein